MNLVTVVPLSPFLGMAWKVGLSFLLISLVIAAISLALAWLTVNSFNPPLKRLVKVTDEVGRGNLSLNIPVDSADEVGELSHAFARMLDSLRGMIGNSQQTALLVMGEASDTYTTANDMSSSMGRVNSSIRYLSMSTRVESERLEKVKRLSEDSTEATAEISRLIREIQKDSRKSLECMERGMERVEGSLAHGSEGAVTVDLYEFLLKTAELSGDISSLAHNAMEQNAVTMHALQEIHSLAQDNAVSAEELYGDLEIHSASMDRFAASSQKLAELAILLQAQTAEFITG
jgi:methyl-accepting chemotaxis protein